MLPRWLVTVLQVCPVVILTHPLGHVRTDRYDPITLLDCDIHRVFCQSSSQANVPVVGPNVNAREYALFGPFSTLDVSIEVPGDHVAVVVIDTKGFLITEPAWFGHISLSGESVLVAACRGPVHSVNHRAFRATISHTDR